MLTHKGTKDIKTERLLLRQYKNDDAESMFKNYATDPRVTKFLNWEPYENVEDIKIFVNEVLASYKNLSTYNWAIEYEGEMIGSISITSLNERDSSCEVGYCISYDYWNKGITSEAMNAVITYLFREVNMHRIMAKHDIDNPYSGKVMQKCKMVYEGTFRKYYLHADGTYSDSMIYSIIREDYDNN